MATWQVSAKSDVKFDILDFFETYNRVLTETGTDFHVYFYDPSFIAYAYLDGSFYETFEFKTTQDEGVLQGTLKGIHFEASVFEGFADDPEVAASFMAGLIFDGDDTLKGSKHADVLRGFAGDDKITGGKGADDLYGGDDEDTFVFKAGDSGKNKVTQDEIFDFARGDGDQIDLSAIDANTGKGANQAFKFIGTHDFKHAGDLRFEKGDGFSTLQGDANGDGKADFWIRVDVSVIQKVDLEL